MIIYKYYGDFLYGINIYDNDNEDKTNTNLELIKNNFNNYLCYFQITENNNSNFLYNDLKISYEDFPWRTYIKLNNDLFQKKVITKKYAWIHWKVLGKKEERSFSCINNSNIHCGRFGNIFFINMYLNFMAFKYDLKCSYKYEKMFNKLGVRFKHGHQIYKVNAIVHDYNFMYTLKDQITPCNLIIGDCWFHTNDFCQMIYSYFKNKKYKHFVKSANKYKKRYKKNNDLFIHLRLGDVIDYNDHKDMYTRICEKINNITYNKGYISSDTITCKLSQELIKKYNLNIINYNEIETIQFGSTCNNIIMSGGTFSWMIGLFAFYSTTVFYLDLKNKWYGDIFNNPKWQKI